MNSDSPLAVRDLTAEDTSTDETWRSSTTSLEKTVKPCSGRIPRIIPETPSSRLVYLDEAAMRAIGFRLINDPILFARLNEKAGNDHVKLEVINDAESIDVVYFAQHIWDIKPEETGETLLDIPALNPEESSCDELYPGAIIRARGFVNSKQDLRPDRLSLTTNEDGDRILVAIASRSALSVHRRFLEGRVLFIVGQLCKLNPLSLLAAAILLARPEDESNASSARSR